MILLSKLPDKVLTEMLLDTQDKIRPFSNVLKELLRRISSTSGLAIAQKALFILKALCYT